MRVIPIATFLAASSLTMMSVEARAADECALKILADVDIITNDDTGEWAFPVVLGDVTKYFLANTASTFSTINESVVEELGIPTTNSSREMISITTGERFNPAVARPPQFQIGTLGANDLALQVERGEGPDGALGSAVLRNYDIELDFVNRKFYIIDKDHCDGQILHWETQALTSVPMRISDFNGHVTIDVKVNGVDMEALINIASGDTSMNLDIARP